MTFLLFSVIFVLGGLIYVYLIKPADHWKKRGATSLDTWFAYENTLRLILRRISFTENMLNIYNRFPNSRYVGWITFNKPQFMVKDLDLIKQITIKDFDNFINRGRQSDTETDPFFSRNLVSLENEKWREMRATLSPTFTTSKMKFVYGLMGECAQNFTKHFEKKDAKTHSLEMKDVFSRFAMDVIATSSFGISVNSLEKKDNEFYTYGKRVLTTRGLRMFLIVLGIMVPFTRKIFRVPVIDKDAGTFFQNVVNETIDVRKKNNVIRPDMIHLLLQTQIQESDEKTGTQKRSLTNLDITAQGILFFLAGFETISTALSFLCYELALHKDIQAKLQTEIDEAWRNLKDGQVSYDDLMSLKYLDMVVSESLRKWPPAVAVDRVCKSDYVIKSTSEEEESIILPKETNVLVPIYPIHRDPKYYPNPDVFDPERFNDEQKTDIVSGSYMPFGVGPRSCIASRFALMELKVILLHLLAKFNIDTTEKTPIPLVLDKTSFNLAVEGGMWLTFNKRSA